LTSTTQQKGKTSLDLTEARDDQVAVASTGPYARLHLCFYVLDALPAAKPTATKGTVGSK